MTEAEARQLAEEEGLQLVPATNNASGFRGVSRNGSSMSNPFRAEIWQGGEQQSLGTFTTVAEAALAVARFLGPAGCAAAAGAIPAPPSAAAPVPAQPAAQDPPMTEVSASVTAAPPPPSSDPAPAVTTEEVSQLEQQPAQVHPATPDHIPCAHILSL